MDFFASERHYAEHLVPIWHQLAPAERGRFYASSLTAPRLAAEGIEPLVALPRVGYRPVVVSAHSDYVRTGHRPVVYVEHGAGQRYNADPASAGHPGYSGGRQRDRTVLFLCNSEPVADANRAVYRAPAEVVGCPKLDRWHGPAAEPRAIARGRAQSTVAFSFHWDCSVAPESRTALPHYAAALRLLVPALLASGHRVLGHGHPKAWARLRAMWVELGAEPVEDFAQVLDQADVYVADNTSTLYEFASTDRPVVVLNAPWYRRDVEHGLRFWQHANVGVQVDDGWWLPDAIGAALLDGPEQQAMRRAVVAEVYPLADGQAARRAADAIRHHLGGRDWKDTPMPDPFRGTRKVTLNESNRPFPGDRLAKLGATPAEVHQARQVWDQLTTDQQANAAAMMQAQSDDELRAAIAADREDVSLEQLWAWASAAVGAGEYPTVDEALDQLDLLAGYLPDELAEALAAELPGECQICAVLPPEVVAGLPEHDPGAHVGDEGRGLVFDGPVPFIGDDLRPSEAEVFSEQWFRDQLPDGPNIVGWHGKVEGDGTGEALPLVGVPQPPEPEPADGSGTDGGGTGPAEGATDGAPAEAAADPDQYDGGTIASVLAYVGAEGVDNRARAAYALGQELARPEADQRKGVLDAVRKIVGTG